MENETPEVRKIVHCKGTIPGTTIKCKTGLVETDGENVFIPISRGREITRKPVGMRRLIAVCEKCGRRNIWHKRLAAKK